MRIKNLLTAFLILSAVLPSVLGEAIVTLKSGEVLQGDILSDTNEVVQMRVYSHNRTISSRREIPHSDIQDLQNETPAQAAEREAYFALSKFQLNPDQEQTTDCYTRWIAAFKKFLTDYPESDKARIIQQRLDACRAEVKHVNNGEVKFANQWMSPKQKQIQSLKKKLTDLQTNAVNLYKEMGRLDESLQKLSGWPPGSGLYGAGTSPSSGNSSMRKTPPLQQLYVAHDQREHIQEQHDNTALAWDSACKEIERVKSKIQELEQQ